MAAALVVIAVAVPLTLLWCIAIWNRCVRLEQAVRESWADVDVELQRRHALIPDLVATVSAYAQHERDAFERVLELRSAAMRNHGAAASQARDANALLRALRSLFAVAENYPELQADAGFRRLQDELALTEDRIAAARRFFNGNVRELRNLRESFPTRLVALRRGGAEPTFFELDEAHERVVPRVGHGR